MNHFIGWGFQSRKQLAADMLFALLQLFPAMLTPANTT
ncbi:hypothetical protein CYB_0499 [Synechococcus sp. JA-2-3B'a(2-13)]|nr:hypothetical protein CYB_0499 [Synechococcus sp. JA-2-3B'a(2-13)]